MKRPLAIVGFSYILALIVASYVGVSICIAISILSLTCGVIVFFSMRKLKFFKAVTAVFFTVAAAFLVFTVYENVFYQPVTQLDGKKAHIEGQICEDPEVKNSKYYYIVKLTDVLNDGKRVDTNAKVKIISEQKIEAEPFDSIEATVVLSKLSNMEQSAFDNIRYNKSKGIYLSAVLEDPSYKVINLSKKPLYYYAIETRHAISSAINKYVCGNEGGLASGILIGDTTNLDKSDKENFTNIGISHLLAVSGTQTSLIMQYLLLLLLFFKLPKRLSAGITAGAIAFFMAITGFSPSVTRAGIMSIVCCAALLLRRNADVINSLGFSGLILCLINPYAATDVGLLLSLSATLGMVLVSPKLLDYSKKKLEKLPKWVSKVINPINSILCETIGASLFTFPILIFTFGKISLISLLANMVEVPLSILVTLLSAVLAILSPVPFSWILLKPIALIIRLICALMIGFARLLSQIPFANIAANYEFVEIAVIFLIALFVIYFVFKKKGAKISILLACWCFVFCVGWLSYSVASNGVISIVCLSDDGSCVVSSNSHAVLLDVSTNKEYPYAIKNYLSANNIKTIDAIVLSKYDYNKIKVVEDIYNDLDIKKLYVPLKTNEQVEFSKIEPLTVSTACELRAPYGVKIKLLPDSEQKELISLVTCNNAKALVTGTNMSGDYSLYNEEALKSNLLIFSKNPDSKFLKSVSPTYSCGGSSSKSTTISELISLGSSIQDKNKIYMTRNSSDFKIKNYICR